MSIPRDGPRRGCSAHFAQPIGEEAIKEMDLLVTRVSEHNNNVVYRAGNDDSDIRRHVFRWSPLEPQNVFINGFQADPQGSTEDRTYYNIHAYVTGAGQPMNPHRNNYAFVSTTLSSNWCPQTYNYRNREVWRYEIYAPGGIWVAQTLANYQYRAQDEVIFVRGINRQYIRSAQRFRLVGAAGGHLTRERVDQTLWINPYIDPISHPRRRLLELRNPVDYCYTNSNPRTTRLLDIEYIEPSASASARQKRDTCAVAAAKPRSSEGGNAIWYAEKVTEVVSYIDAGFRSSNKNEAYLFMKNEYVRIDYAPGTSETTVLEGPRLIYEGFPFLRNTAFSEHGIDCAFGIENKNEAYIFSSNLCARIKYDPDKKDQKGSIVEGPRTIAKMFPFFKGNKGLDEGVDAAFQSPGKRVFPFYSKKSEAYVFKGNQYALINYGDKTLIGGPKKIIDGFHSLKNTIFESGIDAAFASHYSDNEAYLFKGDQYALIDFAPGGTDDKIIGGVKKIGPNWRSLSAYLPRKNHGPDIP